MRFKATVRDPRTLAAVCATAHSFNKRCFVKLTRDRVRFITTTNVTDGTQVWTACRADVLFDDMKLESSNDNVIWLDFAEIGQVAQILRTCCDEASTVAVKLALGKTPNMQVLKITMHSASMQHDAVIQHDVPCRLIRDTVDGTILSMVPPTVGRCLAVVFPNLLDIIQFVDTVRSSGCQTLTITATLGTAGGAGAGADGIAGAASPGGVRGVGGASAAVAAGGAGGGAGGAGTTAPASASGTLIISAETQHASFSLRYGQADVSSAMEGSGEALKSAMVAVDVKRIIRFLSVRGVTPSRVAAYIVDQSVLVLSANATGDTNFVFYLPATLMY